LPATYKQAGVDVKAGDALVDWLQKKPSTKKKTPYVKNVVDGIGGFAALFKASFKSIKNPLLVSCTDGVGTKVLLASQFQRYEGIGQDLVAMCVNDLICTGGVPLFFLDYYATSKLDLKDAKAFLSSVRRACEDSQCVLLGGETAEMPGVYKEKDFDCAGFAVGVVDAKKRLGAHKVKVGDVVIGIASSGFHSNGYSLLRRVFSDDMHEWVDTLLTPTALYVELFLSMQKKLKTLKALAHITGGGLDNLPRVLPKGTGVHINPWPVPKPFLTVKERTGMSWQELLTTLNCGVGLMAIISNLEAQKLRGISAQHGFKTFNIGVVKKSSSGWSINEADWSAQSGT
jgi:phosphoribosylformylglycinamidine cyclo-ligase